MYNRIDKILKYQITRSFWAEFNSHSNRILLPPPPPKKSSLREWYSTKISIPFLPKPHQKSTQICYFQQDYPATSTSLSQLSVLQPKEVGIQDRQPLFVTFNLLECVLKHVWNDPAKQGTGQFEARIGIGLYQPNFEILVYHVVKTKYLKREIFLCWVDFCVD